MRVLPTDTFLGKLTIQAVYECYDKPVLFACQNAFKQAEDDIVYEVTTFGSGHPTQIRVLPTSMLRDEQLPAEGGD